MCAPIHEQDPKTRRMRVIGNLSLAVGLILWVFVRPSMTAPHAWLDAFCGFFMGLSITINLFCLRAARRCRETQPGSL
ncbi:MAG: hypothetical protein ABSF23_02245 [Terracidiphilus sp.]|jgi:hypothetical protein